MNGINFIIDKLDVQNRISNYDISISGEGKLDSQTLKRNLVGGLLKRCPKAVILCGSKEDNISYENIFSIVPELSTIENSKVNPELYLKKTD